MPILKFWKKDSSVVLDSLRLEDITEDSRTGLINKDSFMCDKFKVDNNVYIALNDMFFKMSKIFNKTRVPISAMLIREQNSHIIIVPSRSYVFWNGKSIEPVEYSIIQEETSIRKLLTI